VEEQVMQLKVVEDPAATVAERLAQAAAAGAHIALSGGSTPKRAYELASGLDMDWSAATLWFGDERCVAPDHPDSNYRMAAEALINRLPEAHRPQVRRIEGELGPERGAEAYDAAIREFLGHAPRLDLALMGLGPDGHTASLFPSKPALKEHRRFAAPVPEAGMEPVVPRVTMTFPMFNGAREVVFLVAGADKAEAVARAFGDPQDPTAPAAHVRPAAGELEVVLDPAAARELSGS
jgi:6-phosphogluconolactonase